MLEQTDLKILEELKEKVTAATNDWLTWQHVVNGKVYNHLQLPKEAVVTVVTSNFTITGELTHIHVTKTGLWSVYVNNSYFPSTDIKSITHNGKELWPL
jgi:hypothetical protein